MMTGSISNAAVNLHRTQPAVSAQIASLEKEIGIKLFQRRYGRLLPVPEAHYLLNEANKILAMVNDVRQNLVRKRDLKSGKSSIVSMSGVSMFLLPRFISEFVKNREDVTVSLISHSSFRIQQLVSAQQYDIGMLDMSLGTDLEPSSVKHNVLSYDCFCALPANDPLAKQASISAKDLDGKPLATLYETHSVTQQTAAIFAQQGLTMKRRFETYYFIPQLTFVEQGLAYAIVDLLTIENYRLYRNGHGNIVFLPFVPSILFSVSLAVP